MRSDELPQSDEHSAAVLSSVSLDEAVKALSKGPIGALVVASIAVGVLLIAWLAFYFLLFMPRGPVG
jgi:asparagine N-glycosylation enzyme membrane subunit Stt3